MIILVAVEQIADISDVKEFKKIPDLLVGYH